MAVKSNSFLLFKNSGWQRIDIDLDYLRWLPKSVSFAGIWRFFALLPKLFLFHEWQYIARLWNRGGETYWGPLCFDFKESDTPLNEGLFYNSDEMPKKGLSSLYEIEDSLWAGVFYHKEEQEEEETVVRKKTTKQKKQKEKEKEEDNEKVKKVKVKERLRPTLHVLVDTNSLEDGQYSIGYHNLIIPRAQCLLRMFLVIFNLFFLYTLYNVVVFGEVPFFTTSLFSRTSLSFFFRENIIFIICGFCLIVNLVSILTDIHLRGPELCLIDLQEPQDAEQTPVALYMDIGSASICWGYQLLPRNAMEEDEDDNKIPERHILGRYPVEFLRCGRAMDIKGESNYRLPPGEVPSVLALLSDRGIADNDGRLPVFWRYKQEEIEKVHSLIPYYCQNPKQLLLFPQDEATSEELPDGCEDWTWPELQFLAVIMEAIQDIHRHQPGTSFRIAKIISAYPTLEKRSDAPSESEIERRTKDALEKAIDFIYGSTQNTEIGCCIESRAVVQNLSRPIRILFSSQKNLFQWLFSYTKKVPFINIALIDIGAGTTDISIISIDYTGAIEEKGNTSIPLGGGFLTDALLLDKVKEIEILRKSADRKAPEPSETLLEGLKVADIAPEAFQAREGIQKEIRNQLMLLGVYKSIAEKKKVGSERDFLDFLRGTDERVERRKFYQRAFHTFALLLLDTIEESEETLCPPNEDFQIHRLDFILFSGRGSLAKIPLRREQKSFTAEEEKDASSDNLILKNLLDYIVEVSLGMLDPSPSFGLNEDEFSLLLSTRGEISGDTEKLVKRLNEIKTSEKFKLSFRFPHRISLVSDFITSYMVSYVQDYIPFGLDNNSLKTLCAMGLEYTQNGAVKKEEERKRKEKELEQKKKYKATKPLKKKVQKEEVQKEEVQKKEAQKKEVQKTKA